MNRFTGFLIMKFNVSGLMKSQKHVQQERRRDGPSHPQIGDGITCSISSSNPNNESI